MSVLVVQIPPRRRLGPQSPSDPAAGSEAARPSLPVEYAWVRTDNGLVVHGQGHGTPSTMPRAEAVVLVLAEPDVSWHSVTLPKAPAGRMRAALAGVLEDHLLSDPEQLHLSLAPDAAPGQRGWVAAVDKAWLGGALAAFERQGVSVDRVVPPLWPGERPHGHFFDAAGPGEAPVPALAMADAHGIVCLPLAGSLARAMLPATAAEATRWSAPPAVAAAAERWLGAPVNLRSPGEQLLVAARSTWNLRQFDLSPRLRGSLALRDLARRFLRPAWKPVRVGLVALVALQVVALNVWAWAHDRAVDDKRRAQLALLTEAHPQISLVRDAPLQMERETDRLRAAAGRPGAGDLESMLAAAASAWPDGRGPLQDLRFQVGQLTIGAPGWTPEDLRQFGERLRPAGWAVSSRDGRITITWAGTR